MAVNYPSQLLATIYDNASNLGITDQWTMMQFLHEKYSRGENYWNKFIAAAYETFMDIFVKQSGLYDYYPSAFGYSSWDELLKAHNVTDNF